MKYVFFAFSCRINNRIRDISGEEFWIFRNKSENQIKNICEKTESEKLQRDSRRTIPFAMILHIKEMQKDVFLYEYTKKL